MSSQPAGAVPPDDLVYRWLITGCDLVFEASVGNGHSAQITAVIDGQEFGPGTDALAATVGKAEALRGTIASFTVDVSQRAVGVTPPPPLFTVTFYQVAPVAPQAHLTRRTFTAQGAPFDGTGVARLDLELSLL